MPKVMFLVLDDCSRCKALKNNIGFLNSSFKFYSCNGENELCDEAERLVNINSYPMAIVLDINNNIKEVVYFTDDYNKIGKKQEVISGVFGIGVHSIDQMIDYIIKL